MCCMGRASSAKRGRVTPKAGSKAAAHALDHQAMRLGAPIEGETLEMVHDIVARGSVGDLGPLIVGGPLVDLASQVETEDADWGGRLRKARELTDLVTVIQYSIVQAARSDGVTWDEIARQSGLTRQAVSQRYKRLGGL